MYLGDSGRARVAQRFSPAVGDSVRPRIVWAVLSGLRFSFLRLVVLRLVRSCDFLVGSIDLKIGGTTRRGWWRCAGEGMGEGERQLQI